MGATNAEYNLSVQLPNRDAPVHLNFSSIVTCQVPLCGCETHIIFQPRELRIHITNTILLITVNYALLDCDDYLLCVLSLRVLTKM